MSRPILSILFLAAGVIIFVFFVSPQFAKMTSSQSQLKEINSIAAELESIATERNKLIDIYNSIPQSNIDRLERMIPTGPDAASFLTTLEYLASKDGMALKRLDFISGSQGTTVPSGTPKASVAPAVAKPAGENFTEFPLSIGVEGTYESFRNYLSDLEQNLRLMDITEITFTNIRQNIFDFNIKAKAYYQ